VSHAVVDKRTEADEVIVLKSPLDMIESL